MASNRNTIRTFNFLRKTLLIFISLTMLIVGFGGNFGTKYAAFHNMSEVYRPTINGYKERIMELLREKAERAAKSELARKIKVAKGYYTLEMAPPNGNEMEKLRADLALVQEFIKTGCYKFITVKQAWLLFLVCTEVGLWFYLGETIGKMHIVGYKV